MTSASVRNGTRSRVGGVSIVGLVLALGCCHAFVTALCPTTAAAQEAVILMPDFQTEAEQGSNPVVRAARTEGIARAIAATIDADKKFAALWGTGLTRAASLASVSDLDAYCQTRTSMQVESVLGADFVLCVQVLELSPRQGYRIELRLYGGQIRMNSLLEKAFLDSGNEKALYTAAGDLTRKLLARVEPSPITAYSRDPGEPSNSDQKSGELGQLVVTSEPDGALVRLNATPIGTTPFRMSVPAGSHQVTVEYHGFEERSERVDVQPGGISTLLARLIPMGVRLTLESYPTGAQVYANDVPIGETPIARAIVPAPTGALSLALVKPGYVTRTLLVEVKTGDAVVDRIDLQPLSSTVLVKTYEPHETLLIDGQRTLRADAPGILELNGLSNGPHRLRAFARDGRPEVILHFDVPHAGLLHVTPARQADGLRIVGLGAAEDAGRSEPSLSASGKTTSFETEPATPEPVRLNVDLGLLHALGTDLVGGAVGVDYQVLESDHNELRVGGVIDVHSGEQSYRLTKDLSSDNLIRPRFTSAYGFRWGPLRAGGDVGVGTVFPVHALVGVVGAHLGIAVTEGVEVGVNGSYEPAMFRDVVDWNVWGTSVGIRRTF